MAERKAGDLNLQSLELKQQWDQTYAILTTTENAGEIISIIKNANGNEIEYHKAKALDTLFL